MNGLQEFGNSRVEFTDSNLTLALLLGKVTSGRRDEVALALSRSELKTNRNTLQIELRLVGRDVSGSVRTTIITFMMLVLVILNSVARSLTCFMMFRQSPSTDSLCSSSFKHLR